MDLARLKLCLDRALEKSETLQEVRSSAGSSSGWGATEFIGQSAAIRRVFG